MPQSFSASKICNANTKTVCLILIGKSQAFSLVAAFLLATFCFVLTTSGAIADPEVRIDLRQHSEGPVHGITFSAKNGLEGHAFVSFNAENDQKKMTTNLVVGFYPPDEKTGVGTKSENLSADWKALFGNDTGQLQNDLTHERDVKFTVLVDADQYDRAVGVYQKWNQPHNYLLTISDCTTFVGEIARAIGLETPLRVFAPYPSDYVRDMIKKAEQQIQDAEANAKAAAAQAQQQKALQEQQRQAAIKAQQEQQRQLQAAAAAAESQRQTQELLQQQQRALQEQQQRLQEAADAARRAQEQQRQQLEAQMRAAQEQQARQAAQLEAAHQQQLRAQQQQDAQRQLQQQQYMQQQMHTGGGGGIAPPVYTPPTYVPIGPPR